MSLRTVAALVLPLTLALWCGCGLVESRAVVAPQPSAIASADFAGTWTTPQDMEEEFKTLTIAVTDEALGTFTVSRVRDGETETFNGWLRKAEGSDWVIASVAVPDGEALRYRFALLGNVSDNVGWLFVPDAEKIEKLVDEGKLPGTVLSAKDNHVLLDPLSDAQLKLLTSDDAGVLYYWRSPFIYLRK